MAETVKLAQVMRAKLVESEHYGIVVICKADGSIQSWGDASFSCFTRSIIKSIQVKISKDILGAELRDELLAIAMASHNAESEQLVQVKNLMQKFKLKKQDLYCGTYRSPSFSLDSPIKHNCSGKHFAMLAACIKQGWSREDYYQLEHPLQQAIKTELERLLGQSITEAGIDGCGLPSFRIPLSSMAKIFQAMIVDPSYQEIISSMRAHPYLIGGKQQVDSLLMANSKQLIAKTGAEGLVMVANLESKEALIIKIIDGSKRVKGVISSSLCKELGWLQTELALDTSIYNSRKEIVGHYASCALF